MIKFFAALMMSWKFWQTFLMLLGIVYILEVTGLKAPLLRIVKNGIQTVLIDQQKTTRPIWPNPSILKD